MMCPSCGAKLSKPQMAKRYHYLESGLDDVYVGGVAIYQCGCGERLVQLPAVDRLHDSIAEQLLQKPSRLTGPEFRFLRKWAGLTAPKLAALLGVQSRITISRWENSRAPITAAADHAIRLLVMRLKEDVLKRRFFQQWNATQLSSISAKPQTRYPIRISA